MDEIVYNDDLTPPVAPTVAPPATVATFISKDAMKRIISDVKELEIIKNMIMKTIKKD